MSSKLVITQLQVNEGSDLTFNHVFEQDTSGLTLTANIRDEVASSGTGTSVDSQSGVTAGTEVSFDLTLSGESAGTYDFEIVDGAGKVWYPPAGESKKIVIRDRFTV